jgi:hypothetical protein
VATMGIFIVGRLTPPPVIIPPPPPVYAALAFAELAAACPYRELK